MLPWFALVAVAAAQQGEEAGDQPLAIPAEEPAPPPRTEVVVPDRPLAVPGSAPEHARAVREYRARHLAVRNLSQAYVGTGWSYGWYGGGGYGWPGWGWTAWPRPFVVRHEEQAIFQGPNRLDVPETLAVLGDTAGKERLERRIRRNRTAAGVLFGLGVAGIASSITGLVGMDQARSYDELAAWNAVSWGGVGLMVGGFVGGSFPSSRAWRLQLEPDATMEPAELQRWMSEYNARLASELGLDAMEAVRIEEAPLR
jgi:hypothetical protein